MKFLLDQNLGSALKRKLADLSVEIAHVKDFDLAVADDEVIWRLAKEGGYTIVSKDDDFRERVSARGHPPRVVLIRLGNCPLDAVERALRRSWLLVQRLHEEPRAGLLLITPDAAFLVVQSEA